MSVILVLIGFGVLVAGSFLIAFLWAVRTGQFEDKYTPAIRILFEDTKAVAAPLNVEDPRGGKLGEQQRPRANADAGLPLRFGIDSSSHVSQ